MKHTRGSRNHAQSGITSHSSPHSNSKAVTDAGADPGAASVISPQAVCGSGIMLYVLQRSALSRSRVGVPAAKARTGSPPVSGPSCRRIVWRRVLLIIGARAEEPLAPPARTRRRGRRARLGLVAHRQVRDEPLAGGGEHGQVAGHHLASVLFAQRRDRRASVLAEGLAHARLPRRGAGREQAKCPQS